MSVRAREREKKRKTKFFVVETKSPHLSTVAAAAPRGPEQHHAVARRLHPSADLVGGLPRVDDDALMVVDWLVECGDGKRVSLG